MAIDIKDSQDDLGALNREPSLARNAPGKRFETPDRPDRSLLSHALFSTIGLGIAAYLGRVQEVYAPSPEEEADPASSHSDEKTYAPYPYPDPVLLAQQLASFWTEYLASHPEDAPGTRRYVRYHGQSVDFGRVTYDGEALPLRRTVLNIESNSFDFGPAGATTPFGFRLSLPPRQQPPSGENSGGGSNPGNGNGNGTSQNRAPVSAGVIYLGTSLANLSVLLTSADLARAAIDPDGDRLAITDIRSTSGTVQAYGTDIWLFTPARDMNGIVTFTYRLSDGEMDITGRAWLDLSPHPPTEIRGTDDDDTLLGTPKDDVIQAMDGDDVVYGREGNDIIDGGAGDDILVGGDGNDVIYGGTGGDRILGGAGKDVLFGNGGNDFIYGEEGNDIAYGGSGNDFMSGGEGNDHLFADDGDDILSGDKGDDILDGGAGHDRLIGGDGNDTVLGGDEDDSFIAGVLSVLGNELENDLACLVVLPLPDGNDVFDGGNGCDTYDATATRQGVNIDLNAGYATGQDIGTDRLVSVENAIGGAGNDRITASDAVNVLIGGQGDDVFLFTTLSSLHNGGKGRDEIRDFDIGDKIDVSKLAHDLGGLYFRTDEMGETELGGGEHRGLIKLYKELTDDGGDRQVVQIYSDIDADEKYELVVISHKELTTGDFILTATLAQIDGGSVSI